MEEINKELIEKVAKLYADNQTANPENNAMIKKTFLDAFEWFKLMNSPKEKEIHIVELEKYRPYNFPPSPYLGPWFASNEVLSISNKNSNVSKVTCAYDNGKQ